MLVGSLRPTSCAPLAAFGQAIKHTTTSLIPSQELRLDISGGAVLIDVAQEGGLGHSPYAHIEGHIDYGIHLGLRELYLEESGKLSGMQLDVICQPRLGLHLGDAVGGTNACGVSVTDSPDTCWASIGASAEALASLYVGKELRGGYIKAHSL